MQKHLEEEQVERMQRGTIAKLALSAINLLIPRNKGRPSERLQGTYVGDSGQ